MKKISSILYYLTTFWYYKLIFGQIGRRTRILGLLKIEGPSNIFLGENLNIGKNTWLAAQPLTSTPNCKLTIEDGTYIGNYAHIYCTSQITIGKKVLIADKVYISDNSHSYSDISIPIIHQPIKQLNTVCIGEGAWIGESVSIIGASVGKQSIIGANSVVTRNIPDYCVAAGAPAKVIKRYSFNQKKWLRTDSEGNFLEL